MANYEARKVLLKDSQGRYIIPYTGSVESVNGVAPDASGNVIVDTNIADGSITTAKVANGAITRAKLASDTAMAGANASTAGKSGLVPAPAAGAQGKFLRGDGTWQTVDVSGYLPLSGGTMTGVIYGIPGGVTVKGAGDYLIAARSTDTTSSHDIWFGVGASHYNRGVYDQNLKKWIIYADKSNFARTGFPFYVDGYEGTVSITASKDIVSSGGWMYAGCFKSTSDRRAKKDLCEIHPDLSGIRAYHYRFKSNGRPAYGLIAQEVRAILPDAVTESGEDKHLTLDYNAVVAALVDEVNRLKERVKALECA